MQRAFALCLAALLSSACGSTSAPCSAVASGDGCDDGSSCVANRCRPKAAAVVPVEARRVLVPARRVAVLSSHDVPVDAPVTAFGASASGDLIVLVDFDSAVGDRVEVVGAFLIVDPEPASPGPAAAVEIEVAPVIGAWQTELISYGRAPGLGPSLSRTLIPPAKRAPLRLDVTEFVSKRKQSAQRFALSASGSDPVGARLVTEAESSIGPRLELYLK